MSYPTQLPQSTRGNQQRGNFVCQSNEFARVSGKLLANLKTLANDGWKFRIHKVKIKGYTYLYLKAWKYEEGKQKEKCICRVNDEIIALLREHGILANNVPYLASKARKLASNGASKRSRVTRVSSSISSSKQVQESQVSEGPRFPVEHHQERGWNPMRGGLRVGFHNLVFGFRGFVDYSRFLGLGFRVSGGRVLVGEFQVLGRSVKVFVSRKGGLFVLVGCSGNPIALDEFPRFVEGICGLLSSLLGRSVTVNDLVVRNFEYGVDSKDLVDKLPLGHVYRLDVSIHKVEDKIRREIRVSGKIPLRVLLEDTHLIASLAPKGISLFTRLSHEIADALTVFSGAAAIDDMEIALRDIVVALDEEKVHNIMLYIPKGPKVFPPEGYTPLKRNCKVYVKRTHVPSTQGPLFSRTVEFHVAKGSITVYVKASSSPLSYIDFIKVLGVIELEAYKLLGETVPYNDIKILRVEYNVDKPVQLTLQDMVITVYDVCEEYRRYKKLLPNGGVVERIEKVSHKEASLSNFIEEFRIRDSIVNAICDIKKTLDEIKGSLPRQQLEVNVLSEVLASKLANLEYLLFRKLEEKLKQWIADLASSLVSKIDEYVRPVLDRLKELEEENKKLKEELRRLKHLSLIHI